MFTCYAVGEMQNGDIVPDIGPVGVRGKASRTWAASDRILEIGPGGRVGISVVVYIFGPFIGGDHVEDIIVAGSVALDPAGPEIRSRLQQWPAFFLKPGDIAGDTVIVPGRDAHITR